jgi:hypothetical protein
LSTVSKLDERLICQGLKEQGINMESTSPLCNVKDKLEKHPVDSTTEERKKEFQSKKTSIQNKMSFVHFLNEQILFHVPTSAIDGEKISVLKVWFENLFNYIPWFLIVRVNLPQFKRTRTPDQLRLHWEQ